MRIINYTDPNTGASIALSAPDAICYANDDNKVVLDEVLDPGFEETYHPVYYLRISIYVGTSTTPLKVLQNQSTGLPLSISLINFFKSHSSSEEGAYRILIDAYRITQLFGRQQLYSNTFDVWNQSNGFSHPLQPHYSETDIYLPNGVHDLDVIMPTTAVFSNGDEQQLVSANTAQTVYVEDDTCDISFDVDTAVSENGKKPYKIDNNNWTAGVTSVALGLAQMTITGAGVVTHQKYNPEMWLKQYGYYNYIFNNLIMAPTQTKGVWEITAVEALNMETSFTGRWRPNYFKSNADVSENSSTITTIPMSNFYSSALYVKEHTLPLVADYFPRKRNRRIFKVYADEGCNDLAGYMFFDVNFCKDYEDYLNSGHIDQRIQWQACRSYIEFRYGTDRLGVPLAINVSQTDSATLDLIFPQGYTPIVRSNDSSRLRAVTHVIYGMRLCLTSFDDDFFIDTHVPGSPANPSYYYSTYFYSKVNREKLWSITLPFQGAAILHDIEVNHNFFPVLEATGKLGVYDYNYNYYFGIQSTMKVVSCTSLTEELCTLDDYDNIISMHPANCKKFITHEQTRRSYDDLYVMNTTAVPNVSIQRHPHDVLIWSDTTSGCTSPDIDLHAGDSNYEQNGACLLCTDAQTNQPNSYATSPLLMMYSFLHGGSNGIDVRNYNRGTIGWTIGNSTNYGLFQILEGVTAHAPDWSRYVCFADCGNWTFYSEINGRNTATYTQSTVFIASNIEEAWISPARWWWMSYFSGDAMLPFRFTNDNNKYGAGAQQSTKQDADLIHIILRCKINIWEKAIDTDGRYPDVNDISMTIVYAGFQDVDVDYELPGWQNIEMRGELCDMLTPWILPFTACLPAIAYSEGDDTSRVFGSMHWTSFVPYFSDYIGLCNSFNSYYMQLADNYIGFGNFTLIQYTRLPSAVSKFATNIPTFEQCLQWWESLYDGQMLYPDQLSDFSYIYNELAITDYSFVFASVCEDVMSNTINIGNALQPNNVTNWEIRIHRMCEDMIDDLIWLEYYNQDGCKRYIPLRKYDDTWSREAESNTAHSYFTEIMYHAKSVISTHKFSLRAVAEEIPDGCHLQDALYSRETNLIAMQYDSTTGQPIGITRLQCAIEADEIVRNQDTTDYVFDIVLWI